MIRIDTIWLALQPLDMRTFITINCPSQPSRAKRPCRP